MKYRIGVVLVSLTALTSLVLMAGAGEGGGVNGDVRKIAAALKKGDTAGAEKMAKAAAKKLEEVGDIMHAFKPRAKKGLGFGEKALLKNDGIELKVKEIMKATAMDKDAGSVVQLGYDTAAIALITEAMAPAQDQGKKTRKDWVQWSSDMKASGISLAEAAKTENAAGAKTAATKINAACNSCHSTFR